MRRWGAKISSLVADAKPRLWQSLGSKHQSRAENALQPAFGPLLPSWHQFRLLPRVLSSSEKRAALSLVVLILISGLTFGWRLYDRKTFLVPQTGGEYIEGILGNPLTANPLLATTDADLNLVFLTHRGLFKTSNQGQIITDLAEAWYLSEDQKTYFIKLHPNLHWSDGKPITASDVFFTFESIKETKLGSPLAPSFRDISVTIDDEYTTSFTLKEPYAPFLHALTLGLIPQHIWQTIPYDQWLQSETNMKPIGAGPFRFSSLTRDGQGNLRNYVLEPNPYSTQETSYLKKFSLRFYPDMTSALEALRQGMIDGLGDLSSREQASLNPRRFIIYDITLPQYTAIFYNPNTNTSLRDASVRQALSYAINRPSLIQEALFGQAHPATDPFTFGEIKALTTTQSITYDPTKSIQLFERAGYKRNSPDGTLIKGDDILEITLTVVDNDEQLRVAEEIKRQWEIMGIKVNLQPISALFLQNDVIVPRNYQALLASEVMGLDPDPYPFWHSSQIAAPGLNLAQFQNREADQLIIEARQNPNYEERVEKYIKFQNILQQESPATFLYSINYSYAHSYAIKGFGKTILGQPGERFWDAANWYRRTKRSAQ